MSKYKWYVIFVPPETNDEEIDKISSELTNFAKATCVAELQPRMRLGWIAIQIYPDQEGEGTEEKLLKYLPILRQRLGNVEMGRFEMFE
jgi:hypothetical protein